MAKFNLNDLLNKASTEEAGKPKREDSKKPYKVEFINVHDLEPSKDNFYSMNQIEELKTAIELAGGVKQNLIITPIDKGKYKVLAGHRRRLATLALVEEGKEEYKLLPCKIEEVEKDEEIQSIQEELLIILTNSHREKTDYDKVEEVKRLREILERYKKKEKIPGRMREIIAQALNTSPGQVGRMESIDRKLSDEFKEELKEEKINISTAYELSTLPEEGQQEIYKDYTEKGNLSINDVKEKKAELREPEREPAAVKEETKESKKENISSSRPFLTVFETIKKKEVEELAAFICGRCQKWGRFCDFAIECSENKEDDFLSRVKICTRWLKMKTESPVKSIEVNIKFP